MLSQDFLSSSCILRSKTEDCYTFAMIFHNPTRFTALIIPFCLAEARVKSSILIIHYDPWGGNVILLTKDGRRLQDYRRKQVMEETPF